MIATAVHPDTTRAPETGRGVGRPRGPVLAVLVAGEAVDAISVPAEFAEHVQAELEIMLLAGPVVAEDGSWTFLTQPANTECPRVPADLLSLGVRLVPAGTRIALTTETADRPPAIWSTVIGAARRVAHRRIAHRGRA